MSGDEPISRLKRQKYTKYSQNKERNNKSRRFADDSFPAVLKLNAKTSLQ